MARVKQHDDKRIATRWGVPLRIGEAFFRPKLFRTDGASDLKHSPKSFIFHDRFRYRPTDL